MDVTIFYAGVRLTSAIYVGNALTARIHINTLTRVGRVSSLKGNEIRTCLYFEERLVKNNNNLLKM